MKYYQFSISFCFMLFLHASQPAFAQVTYITNPGAPVLNDGLLNIARTDTSTTGVIDILALHRATTGTSQNGIGGSLMFRNQLDNGGFNLAGRISSVATNASVGSSSHALQFDIYAGGFASNTLYLNETGLGVGTTAPSYMLDVESAGSVPAAFRGGNSMFIPIYEAGNYRGYWGSYSGNAEDVDIGTGLSNTTGKLHLTIKALPKLTIDSDGKVGVGTQTPLTRLDLQGGTTTTNLFKATTNYSGSSDVRAVEGYSVPVNGFGYGGYFTGGWRGIYANAVGGSETFTCYGGYFTTSGTGVGTRTAVYGSAYGGSSNWAGYFSAGNVYVGNDLRIGNVTGASGYKVAVDGKIIAEEVRIQNSTVWPDYVFADDYSLLSIEELGESIRKNKHLPNIPSAQEIETEGILVGDMQTRMMEKIEELTLYIIDLNSQISSMKEEINRLKLQQN